MKHTLLPVTEFTDRRARFFEQMPANSLALFQAAHEVTRSNDTEYPFCQNKNFYYLSGFNEPDALLVFVKSSSNKVVMFSRAKDALQEVWHGRRVGQEKAVSDYAIDECYTLDQVDQFLPELLDGKTSVLSCLGEEESFDHQVLRWLAQVKSQSRSGKLAPAVLTDCSAVIHELRLIKSDAEISLMRKVNQISGIAHQRAMVQSAVGKFEYQIEAEIHHEFADKGARFPAYGSIVAGGDNANILHYTDNSDVLKDNELLLIDAGGELAGYAADITRTFPINGTFTAEQKAIYQLVLDSQNLAIEHIKPESTLAALNKLVCDFLTEGLYKLGILQGELTELIADKACKKYFIHGLGHWLGLDVHDVGDYQSNENREQMRAFESGMVMTIEPGIYIPLDDETVDAKWRGIAVRIEDNIAVTNVGYENLTTTAPKTVADIEALMCVSS